MPLLRLAAALALLALALSVRAEDTLWDLPAIVSDDAVHVLSAPARWEQDDWQNLGLGVLAIAGVSLALDRPVRDEMRRHAPNNNVFIKQVERFGAEYAVATAGAFFLAGTLGDDERSRQVTEDIVSASLIATGLITPAIKLVAGRARPYANKGIYYFKPFSDSNASFPSGHTTEAFALASVIANHYEDTWVSVASYSIAGMVGLARTYHDSHFASDVVAGAMIGTLTGKSVVAHNRERRTGKVVLLPDIAPGQYGLRLAGAF